MERLFDNPVIAKKIWSHIPLLDLAKYTTICKSCRNATYYATFVNFVNMVKNPDMFFDHLINNYKKFPYLTMFDFGPNDSDFHYNNISNIFKLVSVLSIEGLQVYNISSLLNYIEPSKFKCLVTFNFTSQIENALLNYKNLESLVIHHSVNNNLSFVENFEKLQNLNFNNTRAYSFYIFPDFSKLRMLRNLTLTNFLSITNGDVFRIMLYCEKLQLFNITNTRVVLASNLIKYPRNNLKILKIDSQFNYDQIARCFNNSRELEHLNVRGSMITLSGIRSLINNSAYITFLDISLTLINEYDLDYICKKLKFIKFLYIAKCINIKKFFPIKKLRHLEILHCHSNNIIDKDLVGIVKVCNNLSSLNIANCNFLTNNCLEALTKAKLKNPPLIECEPLGLNITSEYVINYYQYYFRY